MYFKVAMIDTSIRLKIGMMKWTTWMLVKGMSSNIFYNIIIVIVKETHTISMTYLGNH